MNKISYVNNKIYSGVVKHTRFSPFHHSFSYKISYFWFRLNDFREYYLFKRNRISIFSFFDDDHGQIEKKGVVEDFFQKKLRRIKGDFFKIKVFCLPRILNYSFNPISVFILYNKREIPSGVILEVNNTFKERHLYFSKIKKDQTNFIFDKGFYVSPFFEVKGSYDISFKIDEKNIYLYIKYIVDKKKVFEASYQGKSKDMNEINLLRTFFTISIQNIKATLGIYIQALKLFFKGAKYISRPKISKTKFTIINERR